MVVYIVMDDIDIFKVFANKAEAKAWVKENDTHMDGFTDYIIEEYEVVGA